MLFTLCRVLRMEISALSLSNNEKSHTYNKLKQESLDCGFNLICYFYFVLIKKK